MKEHYRVLAGAAIVLLLLLATPALGEVNGSSVPLANGGDVCHGTQLNETCGQVQPICVYLFYGQGCPHCERVKPLIDELAVKYPQMQAENL